MKQIFLWMWQLPQNILGFVISRFSKCKMVFKNGIVCYLIPNFFNSGVSLGDYIILDNHGVVNSDTMYHEYGHSIQSRYLGPVYLIFIGLPSLIGNIWDRVAHTKWSIAQRVKWYYNQPWEKGADKLGGVNRFD